MAVYKAEKKERKKRSFKISKRGVGIAYLVISCLAFFFLFTNILPAVQNFILGTFGYFSYALFIFLFMFGLAMINNKKYVLSKRKV